MKILVTGATGFIGHKLVERLDPKGHDITCLVRSTSDTSLLTAMPVKIMTCDILNDRETDDAFRMLRPEAVFHAAAAVEERDERILRRTNITSTRNICASSLKYGVKRVVYLSSIAVISGNDDETLTDRSPYKANSPYGRSKLAAELAALEYREMGLKIAIIRPCMIYGENEPHAFDKVLRLVRRRLLPVPGKKALAGAKLQLGYVGNVAQLMELALYNDKALEGTFLVADKEITTPGRFLELLYEEMGAGRPPVMPGWLIGAAMLVPPVRKRISRMFKARSYDISRAEDLLGYKPEVSLEEGIKRTVAHWKLTCQR
jgi:nucleoside-diphosphate-sugar epimerase